MARNFAIVGVCLVAFAILSLVTQLSIGGFTTTAVASSTFWLGILALVVALVSRIAGGKE